MKILKGIVLIITFFCFFTSCGADDNTGNTYVDKADCSKVPAVNSYNTGIKAILDISCATSGCHDTKSKAEGIILDTYEGAKITFGGNGKGLCSINHDGCSDNMPLGGSKLSGEVLNLLACWVKNDTPK